MDRNEILKAYYDNKITSEQKDALFVKHGHALPKIDDVSGPNRYYVSKWI